MRWMRMIFAMSDPCKTGWLACEMIGLAAAEVQQMGEMRERIVEGIKWEELGVSR